MALDKNQILLAAQGYVFTAPVDTAPPTPTEVAAFTETAGLTGWDNIGHTSRDELPVFGYDGGDTEVLGSWQHSSLRVVQTEAISEYVTFNLNQFDETALAMYYGVADGGSTAGMFQVSSGVSAGTDKALCIVIVDGSSKIAFYASNANIRREAEIELAVDELAFLPLRATMQNSPTTQPMMAWISNSIAVNTVTP